MSRKGAKTQREDERLKKTSAEKDVNREEEKPRMTRIARMNLAARCKRIRAHPCHLRSNRF
jgi:hypothetical protein